MTVTIPLTQGKVALIDEADYPALSGQRWHAAKHESAWYARGTGGVFMHRVILCPPPGLFVDHINGNGLDNRRCNIRLATHAQNLANAKARKALHSRYKGVTLILKPTPRPWVVRLGGDHIGVFPTEIEAALAYDAAALARWGEFARLNFPDINRKPEAAAA